MKSLDWESRFAAPRPGKSLLCRDDSDVSRIRRGPPRAGFQQAPQVPTVERVDASIDGRRRRWTSRRETQDRGGNREDDEAAQMRADDAIRGMGVTLVAGEEPSWLRPVLRTPPSQLLGRRAAVIKDGTPVRGVLGARTPLGGEAGQRVELYRGAGWRRGTGIPLPCRNDRRQSFLRPTLGGWGRIYMFAVGGVDEAAGQVASR